MIIGPSIWSLDYIDIWYPFHWRPENQQIYVYYRITIRSRVEFGRAKSLDSYNIRHTKEMSIGRILIFGTCHASRCGNERELAGVIEACCHARERKRDSTLASAIATCLLCEWLPHVECERSKHSVMWGNLQKWAVNLLSCGMRMLRKSARSEPEMSRCIEHASRNLPKHVSWNLLQSGMRMLSQCMFYASWNLQKSGKGMFYAIGRPEICWSRANASQ